MLPRLALAALLALLAVAPVSAHHTPGHTKSQLKKATKRFKKTAGEIEQQIAGVAIPIPTVTVPANQSATLLTHGPITIKGRCEVTGGGDYQTDALVETTEEGTAFGGRDNQGGSIGPGTPEPQREVQTDRAVSTGGPVHSNGYDDQFSVIAPASGKAVIASVASIAHKDGAQCRFYGHWTGLG